MHLIDLHCDTLYKVVTENIPLDSDMVDVQIDTTDKNHKLQCYAIWLPDVYSGDKAEETFFKSAEILKNECERCGIPLIKDKDNINDIFNKHIYSAYFTIENSIALNGKIENVKKFSELGVKMMTLTWNGRNSVGDGAGVKKAKGITPFGKEVIYEMEKNNIIVDISHASEKLFYDVAEIAKRPFVASHSNSYTITSHKRNLTDEQFNVLIKQGGVIGINFHNAFLSNNLVNASKIDILKHTDHFLSLGGENNICFGSDFDGCDLPDDIKNSRAMDEIYEMFLKHNYKEGIIQKIFYENALKFFENFDNQRIM